MECFDFFLSQKDKMQTKEVKGSGTILFLPEMTNAQYDSIKYIIESCGGHWRERFCGFYFPFQKDEVEQKLETLTEQAVLRHIEDNRFKIDNQFYETPLEIARRMVELAAICPTDFALEPSAGRGMIAKLLAERTHHLFCLEPNEENYAILKKAINLPSARLLPMRFESFFAQSKVKFDAIVMNPPFSDARDLSHIRMAYDLLNQNGRLVALAAENSLFYKRPATISFNAFLETVNHSIETLPYGSFHDSGTSVDVVQIVIHKN